MLSRSCISLLELASGDILNLPQTPKSLQRVTTGRGIVTNFDSGGLGLLDSPSPKCHGKKIIIVANFLPIRAEKDPKSGQWRFALDEDSLYLHLKDGFAPDTRAVFVGSLKAEVDVADQEEVSRKLLEDFGCVPTFLPPEIQRRFYHGFCKGYLWPIFHYMLPICSDGRNRFDRTLWQAYVVANKIFADKVMEVMNPEEEDCVWVHDYHLMILPTFLRKHFTRVKLGFFLHSPFPSSEIYRTLPVRDEILRALLNADLVGFHTFDYARHFLSCCSRMLGIEYESKRGYIGLEYFGRVVNVKILPVGVHMGRIRSALSHPAALSKADEIRERFEGKKIVVGVDDMDVFKGISLKLLAMEQVLARNPELNGRVVLVQIVNPARSSGKDIEEARREIYRTVERVNERFGCEGYKPVILIDRNVSLHEKMAYYSVAECCVVNAVRDGMNLIPYEYTVCREIAGPEGQQTSAIVVSEFVGCSPSLSGAIRVNPWDVEAVADAVRAAVEMPEPERRLRHESHFRYVSHHDVAYWSRSFLMDLERACGDHHKRRCWGVGFGLSFRVLSLSPSFRKLSPDRIAPAYRRTGRRAIFLDYDGTVVPQGSISKKPSPSLIAVLNSLCDDPRNVVFIVSGRGRASLGDWLSRCENLGIAAEHGYFMRWNAKSEWETSNVIVDFGWKQIAEPVMKLYTEATDGSSIETKESALVWHHQDADPYFGSCQAMEMLDHLENVLANEPVVVKRGQQIVEVKPQGITKGLVAEKVLSTMIENGKPVDFVMCVGDDRSDEDMFESISRIASDSSRLPSVPEIFACTVGQKPSKAKYYLDDTADVLSLLQSLVASSDTNKSRYNQDVQVPSRRIF